MYYNSLASIHIIKAFKATFSLISRVLQACLGILANHQFHVSKVFEAAHSSTSFMTATAKAANPITLVNQVNFFNITANVNNKKTLNKDKYKKSAMFSKRRLSITMVRKLPANYKY